MNVTSSDWEEFDRLQRSYESIISIELEREIRERSVWQETLLQDTMRRRRMARDGRFVKRMLRGASYIFGSAFVFNLSTINDNVASTVAAVSIGALYIAGSHVEKGCDSYQLAAYTLEKEAFSHL